MRIPKGAVVFGIVLALAGASQAASKQYDAGGGAANGLWTTPANWDNDTLPNFLAPGDDLSFDAFAAQVAVLNGDKVANSITFNTLIAGGLGHPAIVETLTITTGNVTRNDHAGIETGDHNIFAAVALGANGVWTNNASHRNMQIIGQVSGAYGIEFRCDDVYDPNILNYTDPNDWGQHGHYTTSDPNYLGDPNYFVYEPESITIIAGTVANTYTGTTTMTSGRVEINKAQTGSGNLIVNGGAITVGALGQVTNAGNAVVNNGTVTISAGGKATASGTTTLNGGTLRIGDPNGLGAAGTFTMGGSGVGVGQNVTLALNGDGLNFSRNITVQPHYSDPNYIGDPNYLTGTARIRAEEDATVSGTISLSRDLTVDANSGKTLTISNVISDADPNIPCDLTKDGSGPVILTAANTYAGSTRITSGILATTSTGSVPAASNMVLAGGVFGDSGTFNRNLGTAAGEVQWSATAGGGFAAYVEDPNLSGDLTVNLNGGGADNLVWNSTAGFIRNKTLLFGSGAATDKVTFVDNIDLNNRARTISVANNGSTADDLAEISGVISGSGDPNSPATSLALTKEGSGTLILSANNTFTGRINVEEGNLVFSGSNAYTGTSTISGGSLAVAPSGSIQSASVIRLNGGVYSGSGTFNRSLGDSGSDKICWAFTTDPNDPTDPNLWSDFKAGGFAAYGGNLTVDINGGGADNLVWGTTPHFVRSTLLHGSTISDAKATMIDNIDLGTPADPNYATRTISGTDNRFSDADIMEISGNITGSYDITKAGRGNLILSGNNTFLGPAKHVKHHQWDPNYASDDPNGWIYFDFNSGINMSQSGNDDQHEGILYAGVDNAFGLGAVWFGRNNKRFGYGNIAACGGDPNVPRLLNNELWILNGNENCFVGDRDMIITGPLRDLTGSAEADTGDLKKYGSHTLIFTSTESDYWNKTDIYEGRVIHNGRHRQWNPDFPGQTQGWWFIHDGATLGGTGQIDRTVQIHNGATLQPGHDGIGTLTVSSLRTEPNSIWDFELGALGNNDKVAMSGRLYLDGTLNITDDGNMPYDGANPHIVREYVIATYDPNMLTNNGLDLGTISCGWRRYSYLLDPEDPNYTPPGEVRVAMVHSHPGDANEDGCVNVGDLGILGFNYGGTGKDWCTGDFNKDGVVNVGDLGVLGFNYGWCDPPPYPPPGGGEPVPEPTAIGLVALGGLALIRRRRRH